MHYLNDWEEATIALFPKNLFRKIFDEVCAYIYREGNAQLLAEIFPERNSNLGIYREILIQEIVFKSKFQSLFQKFFGKFQNPIYKSLVFTLVSIGEWKNLALEIYPPQNTVVDTSKTYHLYEIKDENNLPFKVEYCFHNQDPKTLNEMLKVSNYTIFYKIETLFTEDDIIKYLYLIKSDGKELSKEEKQEAKNLILSPYITAFEVVSNKGLHMNCTCLACPSSKYRPNFIPKII